MIDEYENDPFYELYLDVMDDDRVAENRRKHQIKERIAEKKADTGL